MVQAVDDVSFSVRKGETLGIVGESGCGKSTTARLLMRLIEPDAGDVAFDGDPVTDRHGITVNAMRRQMQMVFQDSYSSLNPRMAMAESIAYALRMHGLAGREAIEHTEGLLAQVGVNARQYARRYPHELSGGQRQRVNIARALAPRMVVLDEAVSALDKSIEAQVLNLLIEPKERFNLSYLFISHDLNVVEYVSDRVLVMYLGRVVETGPVEEIYTRPRHPYTRTLFASKAMLDPDRRNTEMPLTGDPPNPINPPSGCRLRTCCPFAHAICAEVVPTLAAPLTDAANGSADHLVACHLADAQSGRMVHHAAGTAGVARGTSHGAVLPPPHRPGRGEWCVVRIGARRNVDNPRRIRLRQERQPEGADGAAARLCRNRGLHPAGRQGHPGYAAGGTREAERGRDIHDAPRIGPARSCEDSFGRPAVEELPVRTVRRHALASHDRTCFGLFADSAVRRRTDHPRWTYQYRFRSCFCCVNRSRNSAWRSCSSPTTLVQRQKS
jgi:peptide/nickel transport system ATP-binding protein